MSFWPWLTLPRSGGSALKAQIMNQWRKHLIHIAPNNLSYRPKTLMFFPRDFPCSLKSAWSRGPCYHWLLRVLTLNLFGKLCRESMAVRLSSQFYGTLTQIEKKKIPSLQSSFKFIQRLWYFICEHFLAWLWKKLLLALLEISIRILIQQSSAYYL